MSVLKPRRMQYRLTALLTAVVLALAIQANPLADARMKGAQLTDIAYAVGVNMQRNGDLWTFGNGFLVAFDAYTGNIIKRIDEPYHWQSPDLLINPVGDRLYLLEGRVSADYKALTETLSLIDTRSWAVLASTPLPDALRYNITGPSTMVLTPDGSRLLVYSYDGTRGGNAYWVAFLDPTSLKVLSTRVPLPGCGAAHFAVAQGQVVAVCFESNDVRFIDPQAATVVATVPLPAVLPGRPDGRVVGLAVSRDQGTVYVVNNDLRITAISSTSHTVLRQVTTLPQAPQIVPTEGAVALSANGRQLIVGVWGQPRGLNSTYTLRTFTLPDLRPAGAIPLARYTHFVAAPMGGLYTFQIGDEPASAQNWQVQRMSGDLTQTTLMGQFGGPVYHIVVPPAASQGVGAHARSRKPRS